jgi:hypothetical protein
VRFKPIQPKNSVLAVLLSFSLFCHCQSHTNPPVAMKAPDTLQNRQPAVAGQFYPSDTLELQQMLKAFFASAPARPVDRDVVALISPHAGYVFSGEVAAAAFGQLDAFRQYKTIFILGCSHRHSFPGASVYSIGNYITPFGTVKTNMDIARKLVAENKVMSFDPQYQGTEHSIEVQLPFLQYYLENDFTIVPVLLGTQDPGICKEIAKALKPFFTADNLFVISTDFSHYPAYSDAFATDQRIADAIVSNNPDKLLKAVETCTLKKVENLLTGCCSWPSVITLMYLTEEMPGITYRPILYRN